MDAIGSGTAAGDAGTRPAAPPPRRRGGRIALLVLGLAVALSARIFCGSSTRCRRPRSALARNADGIVVLTGGPFRINDALELLAAGPRQAAADQRRQSGDASRSKSRAWCPSTSAGSPAASISTIPPPTPSATPSRRGAGRRPADFQSLIVVTSNFHMPRAMAELAHELPDVALVPYPVVSDKVRIEAWWENPETARLLFLEYLKYIVARVRIVASIVRSSKAANTIDVSGSNVVIVRSILFNILFYLNLVVLLVVALITLVLPRRAVLEMAELWGRVSVWLLRVVCGTKVEFRGLENLPKGALHRRGQAPVHLGDVRAAPAVRRLHLHRQARADVDPDLRLVHVEGRHDPGRSRRRLPGAQRHDGARARRKSAAAASSSSFPKARAGRPAPSRATSSAWRISTPRSACPAFRSR